MTFFRDFKHFFGLRAFDLNFENFGVRIPPYYKNPKKNLTNYFKIGYRSILISIDTQFYKKKI